MKGFSETAVEKWRIYGQGVGLGDFVGQGLGV